MFAHGAHDSPFRLLGQGFHQFVDDAAIAFLIGELLEVEQCEVFAHGLQTIIAHAVDDGSAHVIKQSIYTHSEVIGIMFAEQSSGDMVLADVAFDAVPFDIFGCSVVEYRTVAHTVGTAENLFADASFGCCRGDGFGGRACLLQAVFRPPQQISDVAVADTQRKPQHVAQQRADATDDPCKAARCDVALRKTCQIFFRRTTADVGPKLFAGGRLPQLCTGDFIHTLAAFGIETVVNLIEKVAEMVAHQRA